MVTHSPRTRVAPPHARARRCPLPAARCRSMDTRVQQCCQPIRSWCSPPPRSSGWGAGGAQLLLHGQLRLARRRGPRHGARRRRVHRPSAHFGKPHAGTPVHRQWRCSLERLAPPPEPRALVALATRWVMATPWLPKEHAQHDVCGWALRRWPKPVFETAVGGRRCTRHTLAPPFRPGLCPGTAAATTQYLRRGGLREGHCP